ncbi:DUF2169 family type VI secretion system accessory protein [Morganella morganii]|uniref:DUF2169 family type VI secretion system accessory protein n=1 Tax=Morganella morganii TaxID=582 RepID=UPI001C48A6D5|nr:pentapeptide repeat-containing protein [Morganella morganii]QXO73721.1 pentapeptide repeat-containing protein [Morganella morganii]
MMRIIRPQQLAVLRNSYQIGRECRSGISVIAGSYLSAPDHFVTEAQIWQAWKSAPLSFRMLDTAEPKPHAEYILAGHAGTGQTLTALDVAVRVGSLSRAWRLEGEPFTRVAMDHTEAPGGSDCKENPLGKNARSGTRPVLREARADGAADPYINLAAPSPVPPDFHVRRRHIDAVAHVMTDKQYMESWFPGLPPAIDYRYFQMAPPQQQLSASQWPRHVPFELHGFRPDNAVISGTFPAVRARAFAIGKDAATAEEIILEKKTLWLLPDDDLCLTIFTGSIPLPHLFATPAVTLLAALDTDGAERPLTHYQDVYQRRSRTDTANFEFLRDRELMPENSHFNVIRDMAEHPDSLRYNARPLTKQDTDTFYRDVEKAIALHEENQQQYFAPPPEQNAAVPVSDTLRRKTVQPAPDCGAVTEHRDFISLSFANTTLQGKTFKHCHFNQCDFSESQLAQCHFEHCRFTSCLFTGAVITDSQLTGGRFQLSNLSGSTFTGTRWENLTLDDCLLEKGVFTRCTWAKCLINDTQIIRSGFTECDISGVMLSRSGLTHSGFRQSTLTSLIADKTEADGVQFTGCSLTKSSLIGGNWKTCTFTDTTLESVTSGQYTDFSGSSFTGCHLNKTGFNSAGLNHCRFSGCELIETCADDSNLTGAVFSHCDMAGIRLKDAVMIHASLTKSSLQQAMLYNADLRDSTFRQCNFAGANLAMMNGNSGTHFDLCLMDGAHLLPRRFRLTA